MDVPIAQLAERSMRKGEDGGKGMRLSMPMTMIVIVALLAVALTIAIPTGLISRKSSLDTTTVLSNEFLAGSVRHAADKVKSFIVRNGIIVESLANNDVVTRYITTNFYNIHQNPEVNKAMLDLMGSEIDNLGVQVYFCATRYNLSGLDVPTNPYRNTTYLLVGNLLNGNIGILYIEFQTGPALMAVEYIKNNVTGKLEPQTPVRRVPAYPFRKNETMAQDRFQQTIDSRYDGIKCYRNANPALGVNELVCWKNFWVNGTKGVDVPEGACGFTMFADNRFRDLLDSIQGELSRAIILFDDKGAITATSLGKRSTQTCIGTCDINQRIDQTNRTFDSISEGVRTELKAIYNSSFSSIPVNIPQIWERRINGTDFIISVMALNLTKVDKYILATVVPREDVFGQIDAANRNTIIIFVVVTVAVVGVIAPLIWMILKPLHKLAVAMERLTQFEFSVLESGTLLDIRSMVTEIANIQNAFSTMVKAFAGGIRTNRLIINGSGGATTTAMSDKNFKTSIGNEKCDAKR
ncbi:hypothetical protein HK102_001594 [Quaeritorhiza haematococci]|nr:hypothetical protein HK102_001594 [Quaeritorhiza haematococci]